MYRLSLCALLLLAAVAPAQSLSTVNFGEVVRGSKPELDDLKGRVVVIEFWGIH
ncbi:MAG: hypothetical protein K1X57_00355 [Gemmataceae bacterium]|nr:hypothetical protein [Gemmataceae bacterium]